MVAKGHVKPVVDATTLEVSLRKEKAFPIAYALREKCVRCVFVTGYDSWALPDRP